MRVECQRGSRAAEQRRHIIDPDKAHIDYSHNGDADRDRRVEKSAEAEAMIPLAYEIRPEQNSA